MGIWDSISSFIGSDGGGALIDAGAGIYAANQAGGETTTQQTTIPEYMKPYLTGEVGTYPMAQASYLRNMDQGYIGQSPEQQAMIQQEQQRLQGLQAPGAMQNVGQQFMQGQYDPNASQLDMNQLRQGQGSLDPTGALQQALSGQPNMDVLGQMNQANINQSMQGYNDMTDAAGRMFSEQINPAIGQGAQAAGQYGGSRQGLAQGVAMRDIGEQLDQSARDMQQSNMDYGNTLYGNAYQNAQAQQANTGMNLNAQSQNIGQLNNQLGFDLARTQGANQMTGINALNTGEAAQGQQFQSGFDLGGLQQADLQAQQQFPWQQLGNYAGIVGTDAGMTQTSTGPGMNPLTAAGYGINLGQGIRNLDFGGSDPAPTASGNTGGYNPNAYQGNNWAGR
jgi:hypothetical protein